MTIRRVRIVVLCEDSQHEAFVRRFLEGMGWNTREIRVLKSPAARGSAEQWVREKFPQELKAYRDRKARAATALVVMIDADAREVSQRIAEFEAECTSQGVPFRTGNEAVAIAVPKRNIESWIHYLADQDVNEEDEYPKLEKKRSCQASVAKLVQLCKTNGLPPGAPSSLLSACLEYRLRIKPMQ